MKHFLAFMIGAFVGAIIMSAFALRMVKDFECPVAFVDYYPDIVASQIAMGLEPDGKPFKAFGDAWIKAELDTDMAEVMREFGGEK